MIWKQIETAPRDGTVIILTDGFCVYAGCYGSGNDTCNGFMWAIMEDNWETNAWSDTSPTHWMPLPEPPETDQ